MLLVFLTTKKTYNHFLSPSAGIKLLQNPGVTHEKQG